MAKKIKKWTVFSLFVPWMFVIWGITVVSMYIEHEVDPNIIPLTHDQISYIIAFLAGGSILAITIYMFSGFGVFNYFKEGRDRKKILKEGKSVKAKIIKLDEDDDSVVTVNDQPFVKLILEIFDDKKPYQVELKTIISRLAVPQFQEGNIITVKVDPNDKMKVVIDPEGEIFKKDSPTNLIKK